MKKDKKIKHKSTRTLRKKAWGLVSQYVRRIAADAHGLVACYTCDGPHFWKDMECGHYIHKDCLDYNLDNLRAQCNCCNRRLHGNLGVYAERLIKEIGMERVLALRELAKQLKKFNVIELEEIILDLKEKLEVLNVAQNKGSL